MMGRMKEFLGDGLPFSAPHYPHVPGHENVDTSIAAASSMKNSSAGLRGRVKQKIKDAGSSGATCDEIEIAMKMKHQTISARIRELVLFGEIEANGVKRKTSSGRSARVYVVKSCQ